MARNQYPREEVTAREVRAYDLRIAGHTVREIARELKVDPGTVSRILERINRRELKRLSDRVESVKVEQTLQLESMASQALRCFEKSQRPMNRATRRTTTTTAPDGTTAEVTVEESAAVERDGSPAWLASAMTALAQIRALWGLDLGPSDAGDAGTVSEIARGIADRVEAYQARQQAADPGGPGPDDRGGAPPLPG